MTEKTRKIKQKRHWGDRRDGYRVKDLDALHVFMPYIMPNRADNEAVLNELLDLTKVNDFLALKNENAEFKYTLFHFVCAALAKTIQLRPCLNRFYSGHRLYQRYNISFSFVVKKQFKDDGAETLIIINYEPDELSSPIEQFHGKIREIVTSVRKKEGSSGTMDKIGFLAKIPRPIMRVVMRLMKWLDYHGWMPESAVKDDPDYATVFVTNLGSIKMNANYHHLANWGTNSFFVVINSKKQRPFFNADGSFEMKDSIEIGMTIDERIADGVYFAKSLKVLRYFFEHPEELDLPANVIPEIDTALHS